MLILNTRHESKAELLLAVPKICCDKYEDLTSHGEPIRCLNCEDGWSSSGSGWVAERFWKCYTYTLYKIIISYLRHSHIINSLLFPAQARISIRTLEYCIISSGSHHSSRTKMFLSLMSLYSTVKYDYFLFDERHLCVSC